MEVIGSPPNDTKIFVGQVEQKYGITTAMIKKPIKSSVYLSLLGLEGDECADTNHHGGPNRALHQYPAEHYSYWRDQYESSDQEWVAPGMGENISTLGMIEDTVCIGDQYRFGEAIIEVSQPRSPCFKLNSRWNVSDISVCMQGIGRCGWLFRVIEPGLINVDATLTLIARDAEAVTVKQVCELFFGDPLNRDGLLRLKSVHQLSSSWCQRVERRLATGEVENWSSRLLADR